MFRNGHRSALFVVVNLPFYHFRLFTVSSTSHAKSLSITILFQTPESTEHQTSMPIFTIEGCSQQKKLKMVDDTDEELKLDTVGAVAVDLSGESAASCSSGGVLIKLPGRVGQVSLVESALQNVSNDTNRRL